MNQYHVTLLNKSNQTKKFSFNHTSFLINLEMKQRLKMSGGNLRIGEIILVEVMPFN
jgi:hypothetical protein